MWYKAWADVGGRASKRIEENYFWFSGEMTEDWRDDFWHQYFGRMTIYSECGGKGKVEDVKELPENVRQDLIEHHQRVILNSEIMLERLK